MTNNEARPRDWLVQVMNHVEGQVMFGDTKAGQLLTANSVLLTALSIFAKDLGKDLSTATLILGAAAGIAAGTSLVLLLISLAPSQAIPRGRGIWRNSGWDRVLMQRSSQRGDATSLVHFVSIADTDIASFVERAATATSEAIEDDLLRAIHGKSVWARHKFVWIDRAVKTLLMALVLIIVAVVVELMVRSFT